VLVLADETADEATTDDETPDKTAEDETPDVAAEDVVAAAEEAETELVAADRALAEAAWFEAT